MLLEQAFVAGGAPSRMQRYQIERRRIGRSVIGSVRDELEMRELAVPQFVKDFAWFGIAIWIVLLGLQRAQNLERAASEFRIDQRVLQRNDQAVAAEGSNEPWQPGGGEKHDVVGSLDRQTQRGHVLQRLMEETVEFLVAGPDLDHCFQPFRHRLGMAGFVNFPEALGRRAQLLLAILERIEQARVPGLARLERNLEAQSPIGGNSLARCVHYCDRHRALKILVRIGRANPLPSFRPFRGDLTAAHDLARFHLEDVGEVAAKGDLELKAYRLHAVVGDVEILVQATTDPSTDRESNGARRDRAVFGKDGP